MNAIALDPALQPLVLLALRHPDERDMYTEHLTWCGYRVATAASGAQALEAARTLRPDLIVIGQALYDPPGEHVCRQLRADRDTSRVPLIFLASYGGLTTPCDLRLVRPVLPETLEQAAERLIHRDGLSSVTG